MTYGTAQHWCADPLAPLCLFTLALSSCFAAYLIAGVVPSAEFETVASVGASWIIAGWVVRDADRRHATPSFDFGFFCYLYLPLIVPWHCLRTRGWRGLLTLGGLTGLWLGPYLLFDIAQYCG